MQSYKTSRLNCIFAYPLRSKRQIIIYLLLYITCDFFVIIHNHLINQFVLLILCVMRQSLLKLKNVVAIQIFTLNRVNTLLHHSGKKSSDHNSSSVVTNKLIQLSNSYISYIWRSEDILCCHLSCVLSRLIPS